MPDSRARAYAEKLDALARSAEALTPEAQKRILQLLEETNREILAELSRSDPSSYNAAHLHALKVQVDRAVDEFTRQASSAVGKIQEQSYREAASAIDATVAAGTGVLAVHPVIDQDALRVVQGYTADLIGGISRDGAAKINAAIQRAYLGGMSVPQLVHQVGNARYGEEFTGIFGQMGRHTVDVSMNEIMRVNSVASMARINTLSQSHPNLGKGWRHIPAARVPRISHMLANGQVRRPSEPFDIGGEELMYPRDPKGSAENTIFCHCLLYPAIATEDLKPSDRERDLLKSMGISVSPSSSSTY